MENIPWRHRSHGLTVWLIVPRTKSAPMGAAKERILEKVCVIGLMDKNADAPDNICEKHDSARLSSIAR